MDKITTCLWFDRNAVEAANHYVSLFPDSRIDEVNRAPSDYPGGKKGDVLIVEFTLDGRRYTGLNGGAYFKFTEAISFQIEVADQTEADRYYAALSAVPEAEQCGWVKDRFGLSWQIIPKRLLELLRDPATAQRANEAMLRQKRIDIAEVERAVADGG